MVSGFVTSPCDQLRIFSGEARLMRIASKSAIGFARSNGLERNKIPSNSALKAVANESLASCRFLFRRAESSGPWNFLSKPCLTSYSCSPEALVRVRATLADDACAKRDRTGEVTRPTCHCLNLFQAARHETSALMRIHRRRVTRLLQVCVRQL